VQEVSYEEAYSACVCILDETRRYFFKAGYIENWVVLIDAEKVGALKIRYRVIKKLIKDFQRNFFCCVHKIIILNPSLTIRILFGYCKSKKPFWIFIR
jgi:CRAL/TRIO domain